MEVAIKSLRVPDFEAKPIIVKEKDGHHVLNPEVFLPWSIEIVLESAGEVRMDEANELMRMFEAMRFVNVTFKEKE